jgi:rare lipoprotein A
VRIVPHVPRAHGAIARLLMGAGLVAATLLPATAAAQSAASGTPFETGIASTYGTGDGFQGNTTACGQKFDTFVPQVAHKTLPCGTMVRVEDVATGKSVDVEVTDRGPYIKGRIVDLSWSAYRELDPSGPGLLDVRVFLLPDPSEVTKAQDAKPEGVQEMAMLRLAEVPSETATEAPLPSQGLLTVAH